ncbi:dipeptidase PepE [Vibrio sp. CAIM 722]|uniref:Dipeptidase PepE n=1 Tax=Vibrio eleionomae TaxID=2653505 RepID=A0A7X4LJF9_9VIBR|nr:dipeptidase PepE [Vibrio eleionomae]MZI92966.1 dipeptidase PepE [Vibrio eleionomae]
MNLLLCSSSGFKNSDYLSHTKPMMEQFFAGFNAPVTEAIFVPYAGVTRSYDEYLARVAPHFSALGIKLVGLHQTTDPKQALDNAQMIIVGGGNTFALLSRLQQQGLVSVIQNKVRQGTPYIGWSAGSNLSGTSISTTNDMPIVQPETFSALCLVPFLINPHFISGQIPGHNGESREQRLAEFMVMNPKDKVVALVEGSALLVKGDCMTLIGAGAGHVFLGGEQTDLPLGECSELLKG